MATVPSPRLGPVVMGSLITRNNEQAMAPYLEALDCRIIDQVNLNAETANAWNSPQLNNAPVTLLGNPLGDAWLRLIEAPQCIPRPPFRQPGWMSLEICVEDVDALYPKVKASGFTLIGEPANLDISDDIRAMQVIGPSGEVLYLTQIKAPVQGFDLPLARCSVDRLFIPVLLTPSREESLHFYETLCGASGLCFDTKITVLSNAHSLPVGHKHAVATLQLQGESLIEIDQFDQLQTLAQEDIGLSSGIAMISLVIDGLTDDAPLPSKVNNNPYSVNPQHFQGEFASLLRGVAGEYVELITRG